MLFNLAHRVQKNHWITISIMNEGKNDLKEEFCKIVSSKIEIEEK